MSEKPAEPQHTEAVAFDPFADDEEPGTEARVALIMPAVSDSADATVWPHSTSAATRRAASPAATPPAEQVVNAGRDRDDDGRAHHDLAGQVHPGRQRHQ